MLKYFFILSIAFSINSYASEQKKQLKPEQIDQRLAALQTARNKIQSEQGTTEKPSQSQQQAWDFQLSVNFDQATRLRIKKYRANQTKPIVSTAKVQSPKIDQKSTAHFDWIEKLVKAFDEE